MFSTIYRKIQIYEKFSRPKTKFNKKIGGVRKMKYAVEAREFLNEYRKA